MIQQETKECITAAILAESMRAERIHGLYHSGWPKRDCEGNIWRLNNGLVEKCKE